MSSSPENPYKQVGSCVGDQARQEVSDEKNQPVPECKKSMPLV